MEYIVVSVANLNADGCWLKDIMGSLQRDIVGALRLGERNKASKLLYELGSASQGLLAKDFVYILQYCATEPDPLFVMETWKVMKEKDIELSEKCYFLTIRALSKAGYLKEAFNILSFQCENSEIYPTLPFYNTLLGACIQMHSFDLANECLHMMEVQGVGKNLVTHGLLLKLAVLQQDLSAVHNIWKECINLQSLSIITLRKFIWSFAMLRDLKSAYMALQKMVAMALQQKCNITSTADGKLFDLGLDIPIPSRLDLAGNRNGEDDSTCLPCGSEHYCIKDSNVGTELRVLGYTDGADKLSLSQQPFTSPVTRLLRWSFGDVIHGCANVQNVVLAKQLMLQMQNLGLDPSRNIYDGFIKALVSVKDIHYGIEVLKIMQQKNMKPFDSTLSVLSVRCSKDLELDLAEKFLSQMSSCRHPYPLNAFLEGCHILDLPERGVWALAKMKELGVLPDIRTYELMFSLFGNVNSPYEDGNELSQAITAKRISIIEEDMMMQNIQHSPLSMQNLLKALGMEGMIKEMIKHLHVAENRNSPLDISIYNTVLHVLVKAKESRLAVEIFKSIISSGPSPDAATYKIMINCCSTMTCYSSACALVSRMIQHGIFPDVLTYTALIKAQLNSNNFDEALQLLDQACSKGLLPDVVLYNTILSVACEKGRIDVIELITDQMHQAKIQPNPSTCSHVFLAYVNNGYYSTAMEALQVLCMRMMSEEDDTLEELPSEYEDLLFSEDLEAESQIMKVFKDSEYLATALLYLRWCATLGFPISWSPNQSLWARRLSRNHMSEHNG
ncbi:pentatricopeptide repeat-containing protein At1g76280 isoform X2 [Andrographis paniculata]|uniref:pentatricopeptide repeat-containing protein At1g76280 isoform X2 n=1 Tax=Andrographis paniculata TaxID=175694 RepID=UPI0021E80540|nr:pentatricopeptide repeat-containing protein At1g76280 isoform X2 [Andrographis paniculata]